jgi:hypothetical protein
MAVFPITKVPLTLGGLVLWLDANDPAADGTQPSNNSNLSSWVDKSGNKNNATQATGANQPLFKTNMSGGLPAIEFDGVNDFMLTTNTLTVGDNTIFVVQKILTVADTRLLFWYSGGGNGFYFLNGQDGASGGNGGSVDFFTPTNFIYNTALSTGFYITSRKRASTTATLYKNGVSQASAACNSGNLIGAICLGGANGASACGNNDICEVLVYRRALSDAERSTIDTYLKNKWGI